MLLPLLTVDQNIEKHYSSQMQNCLVCIPLAFSIQCSLKILTWRTRRHFSHSRNRKQPSNCYLNLKIITFKLNIVLTGRPVAQALIHRHPSSYLLIHSLNTNMCLNRKAVLEGNLNWRRYRAMPKQSPYVLFLHTKQQNILFYWSHTLKLAGLKGPIGKGSAANNYNVHGRY